MNCADCGGPVDVPCFYGAKLRCGCGKTYQENARHDTMNLEGLLGVLRANKVTHYRSGDLELTLAPEAFRPAPLESPQPELKPEMCGCGHDVDAHTDAGCMTADCDPKDCEAWAKKQSTSTTRPEVALS